MPKLRKQSPCNMLVNSYKRREVKSCCLIDPTTAQCHSNFRCFCSLELADVNEINSLVFRPSILNSNKSGRLACSNLNDCFSVPINHCQLPACRQIFSHGERKCAPYLELNQCTKCGVCIKSHRLTYCLGYLFAIFSTSVL